MSAGRLITLANGVKMPQLGFGTWQSEPGQVSSAIVEALKAGYKLIDCAKVYGNQKEVGQGIEQGLKAAGLKREDIFITSKVWNSQHDPKDVPAALDDCLEELGLKYLDLYLIHFPVSFKKQSGGNPHKDLFPLVESSKGSELEDCEIEDNVSIVDTWKAMLALPKEKVRTVGVSNFTVKHLEAITKATGQAPAVNQVEMHLKLQDKTLLEYCNKNNIHLTGYSNFGNNMIGVPLLVNDEEVKAIAKEHNAAPSQVLLAWCTQRGASVIPKSVTANRIVENFKQIELSPETHAKLDAIGQKTPSRFNIPMIANKPRWNINVFDTADEQNCKHQVIV